MNNSIETICNRIIDNALSEKERLLSSSKLSVDSQINELQKELDEIRGKGETEINRSYNEMLDGAKNSARLEVNKLALRQKQEILNEIFDSVTDRLCNLEAEQYGKLMEKLIIEYAKDGDGISISADSKVNEKFITNLEVYKERNMKFLYHRSNIRGGFVLYNSICDTIVSFEGLVEEYKEKYAYEIINKLFA